MPISEDEYTLHPTPESHIIMSKAELRKTHKPIMEKRRRARINHCLNEIKTLILEAMNKDPARHSKLEKADILEMAVKHLQNIQRQQLAMAMATDPSVLRKFRSGFNECANEIDRYVSQIEGVDSGIKERMMAHLQKCIGGIEQVAHFNFPGFSNLPFISTPSVFRNQAESTSSIGDQNNNATRVQIPQSIQLIPSRLPSGEIALLFPPNTNTNLPQLFPISSTATSRERPSAFVTVTPSSTSTSNEQQSSTTPLISPIMQQPIAAASPSPQGFRPVQASKSLEPQVQQISSTSFPISSSSEVKSVKFPIHTYIEKKKIVEPLCVITNQGERYKQAFPREDAINFEENRPQGVKRKFGESQTQIPQPQGLLTLADNQEYLYPPSKCLKIEEEPEQVARNIESTSNSGVASGSKDTDNSDMWRPW